MFRKKEHKNEIEKVISRRQDLKVRLISVGIMLVILIGYLSIAIISTEATRWNLKINTNATNSIFFGLSAIFVGLMAYEAITALGFKQWWAITILVLLTIILFIFPFFVADSKFPINEIWNFDTWFKWWQTLIFLFIFVIGFILIGQYAKNVSWFTGLKVACICLLIVLGIKGFTILILSMGNNEPQYGFVSVIWIWGTIIATDSFAYFGGTRFGKHKLAPKISPKKSWEGSIIGTIGAFVFGSLLSLLVFYLVPNHDYGPFEIPFKNLGHNLGQAVPGVFLVLLTFVFAILAQCGDLLFSLIKRSVNIKDYSKLIPGHGGILDRLDSFIFTFFFIFIIVQFI